MNSNSDTETSIDAQAAEWVIRIDRSDLPSVEQHALDAWLDVDPRHKGAFIRAQAAYDLAGQLSVEDLNEADQSLLHPAQSLFSRRRLFLGGAAAALAAGLAVLYIGNEVPPVFYQTKKGEMRSLPLSDGSAITMNTNRSEISVQYKSDMREIKLIRGEALFDVAKDPKRPFTVTAGTTVSQAVGTSFVVRRIDKQPVELMVREGTVEMFRQDTSVAEKPLLVSAHSLARSTEIPFPSVKLIETALDDASMGRYLAWQQGMVSFNGDSLGKAVAEFNRYSDIQIVVEDPKISSRTVTGLFSIHNPVGFARTVAVSLDLNIQVSADRVMLWK